MHYSIHRALGTENPEPLPSSPADSIGQRTRLHRLIGQIHFLEEQVAHLHDCELSGGGNEKLMRLLVEQLNWKRRQLKVDLWAA